MSIVDNITLEVTLKNNVVIPLTASNYLVSYSVLYELDSDITMPNATISANELRFGLENSSSIFSPHNEASQYYGLIGNGLKVVVKDKGVQKGVFYTQDWSAPRGNSTIANIRCVDKLQMVLNNDVDIVGVDAKISLKDYLITIFNSVGILTEDLKIDDSIDTILNFSVAEGSKLSNILNDISLSADVYIYVDDVDKIVVVPKEVKNGVVVGEFKDSTNIYTLATKDDMSNNYNKLSINYSHTALSDVKEVLKLKQLDVGKGVVKTDKYTLDNENLYDIDRVKCTSKYDIGVIGLDYNKKSIKLELENTTGEAKKVDIVVYGRYVELNKATESVEDSDSIVKIGAKNLDVDVNLVQTSHSAKVLANKVWGRLSIPIPYINISVVLDGFNYKLYDRVDVIANIENISYRGYIHSINYKWVGGSVVKADIGVKYIALNTQK